MEEFEDQSEIISRVFSLHLKTHEGKLDKTCPFCKEFIIPFMKNNVKNTYQFIIFDVTDKSKLW